MPCPGPGQMLVAATDFTPVALVAETPIALITRKDLPASNFKEFVAHAKESQAKMQFASAGAGSATHLGCVLLNFTIGVNITHVPYRGAGPVMQDLIAGRIDYMCDTIQAGAVQVRGGTVKGIAVMAPKRVPIVADLATTGEQGLPGAPGQLPSIEQVMPWLHLIFDAYEDYKKMREHEAAERAAAEQAALEAAVHEEASDDEDDGDHKKKKKKHKNKDKDKDKHRDKFEDEY